MKNIYSKDKGFTLVETLVAVAILMIAIAGPLTIAQKSLMASIYAKDQVTASFLAQDAMEYVKNWRDSNISSFATWVNDTMSFQCGENRACNVDTTIPTSVQDVGNNGYNLYFSNDEGYRPDDIFGISPSVSSKKSIFVRKIYVYPDPNGYEATVRVIVEWKSGTVKNAVTMEEQIFDVVL